VIFVKVRLVGEAVKVAGVTAVPLNGIDKLGFDASEVTVTVPLFVPADFGAYITVNDMLCPGVKVPAENPETLNPVPDAAAAETVVFTPPVFVSVSVWLEVCPVVMFVYVMLVKLGVTTAGVAPVPDTEKSTVLLIPVTVSEIVPLLPPAAVGANFTVKLVAWVGAKVSGKVNPLMLKPAPVTVACVIVRL